VRQELSLAARLTIAIMALAVFTAGAVGFLGYRSTVAVATQRTLVRLDTHAGALASDLANIVNNARADAKGFRYGVGLMDIIAENGDPQALATYRARVAKRYAAELVAKPDYADFFVIGIANGARELIRVQRGEDNIVRIAPDIELRAGFDISSLAPVLAAPDGTSVVSTIDFAPANGAARFAYRPVVRVSTPLMTADGKPFGVLIINVDLRTVFKRFSEVGSRDTGLFLTNERGDYLPPPEDARPGYRARIQDNFPALARAVASGGQLPDVISRRDGKRFLVGFAQVPFQDGQGLSVVETVAEDQVIADPGAALVRSSLIGGGIALLGAVLLASLLARTVIRPLTQMTAAVENFSLGEPLALPLATGGEIAVLARAFETMARDARDKAAAIKHDKDVFEGIMATMAESVLLVDATGRLRYQNSASIALVGMLLDRNETWNGAFEVFGADGVTPLPRAQWPSARSLRGESVDELEMLFRTRGPAALKHLVCSARPIRDANGVLTGAVIVTRDVTQARETERQLHQSQKLEAIGQLTGGVAHDFNNMLTVITGTSEILIDSLADRPDLMAIAKMIEQAADRGAALTRHLLAFARKQPLQPRDVDVNGMVINVAQLLRPTLGEHIEIESALEDDVRRAHIDPSQLSAALLNLAVNARDAMPDGGRLLLETDNVVLDEIYAQHNSGVLPGPYIMIAVSDTGTGIPAHLRDKVFEPFFTTKEVGKGTGLGLSMVYGFVKQSNGHVKIYSEEGYGTTIKLYLPPAERLSQTLADATSIEGGGETIFVVEDDPLVRDFVVAQLRSLGYKTIMAPNGSAALAQVDDGVAFDLLFTDVIMPDGMNGRQLADAIVQRRPRMKVLYTSGYTEDAIVHHGRLDADVLLLPKPYRKTDLARMIRIALTSERGVAATRYVADA
jgi:signal transduction histidine kinase